MEWWSGGAMEQWSIGVLEKEESIHVKSSILSNS
jgi:hypothetical protein